MDMRNWLPTTRKELEQRGWEWVDVILFSGDAYVDHPSFGVSVIGRVLEAEGLRVAIVPQPNWRDDLRDFKKLGKPRLFFGVFQLQHGVVHAGFPGLDGFQKLSDFRVHLRTSRFSRTLS